MASRGFCETAGGSRNSVPARAGLDPAIHVFTCGYISVDDRVKPGHDDRTETGQITKCDLPSQGGGERERGAGTIRRCHTNPTEDDAMSKIAPCLWFDERAEEAANFYVATFRACGQDAALGQILRYGAAGPKPRG